jgi:hypothetical protein
MHFDGPLEEKGILPDAPAGAMDETVDLVDERFEHRPDRLRKAGQQLPEGGIGGAALGGGKIAHHPFPMEAFLRRQTRLLLDGRHGGEHGGSIAPVKGTLLLFEKSQQAAVFLQLVAQAGGNCFPSGIHGFSSPAR